MPIPIKDLNETAGLRTTYSCKAFADNVPQTSTRRSCGGSATRASSMLGKTNTPEFGIDRDDRVRAERRLPQSVGHLAHARRLERRRGGRASRPGSVPVAHGSDGGGSIRIPSSCCGLFGIKPSRGRVSPAPYGSGSLGLGTSGPIARTVRDAAALLDVMAGYEPGDFYVAPHAGRGRSSRRRTSSRDGCASR